MPTNFTKGNPVSILREILLARKESFRSSAEKLKLSPSYIYRVSKGEKPMNVALAVKVREAYELSDCERIGIFAEVGVLSVLTRSELDRVSREAVIE